MLRFLFPLLLAVAGALVLALFRDRREREQRRLASLRGSFLHGSPLGGFSPPRGLAELVAPGDVLHFRLPFAWSGGFEDPATASFDCGSGRRLRLDLLTLEAPQASRQTLLDSLGALKPEPERSLESLPNDSLLLKYLETRGQAPHQRIVFCWHLARLLPSRQAQMAVFAFAVPAGQAGEVFVQADLALLDREVRAARLGS